MVLTVGAAREVITPPVGIPMSGYAGRGPALDVHDDLSVTAVVLGETSSSGLRHAIVTLDLIGLYSDDLVRTLKSAVQAACGIHPDHIHLSCSHTHYGPVVAEHGDMPGGGHPLAEAYRRELAQTVAHCVRHADEARAPATVHVARGRSHLGVNRRLPTPDGIRLAPNPAGDVDPELLVLRFRRTRDDVDADADAGESEPPPLATLVNYACHPSSLGASARSISSDFVGAMRKRLDQPGGGMTLFLQGAAGDIDPVRKGAEWSIPDAAGELLARDVALTSGEEALVTGPLTSSRAVIAVPRGGARSVADIETELLDLRRRMAALAQDDDSRRWWLDIKISESIAKLEALRAGMTPTIDAEISAIRVGDSAIAFVPAELFSSLGRMIKDESPFPHTMVVGYTDGMLWYVPTRSAFAEGGYEVKDACRVAPGAGELIVARVVELLEALSH
jgi:neutral ceramidase